MMAQEEGIIALLLQPIETIGEINENSNLTLNQFGT